MKNYNLSYILPFLLLAISGQLFAQHQWDVRLTLNQLDCQNRQAWYTLELRSSSGGEWALADQNYRLFFDGDLMTVNSVRSLLPADAYTVAQIDQNLKFYGQGQEEYSPLDRIDDHLGFLDFSIVRKEKANPGASLKISRHSFTPVAEIAMDIDAANFNSINAEDALSMYFSREKTAGNVTRQYTVITEHDGVNHTRPTRAGHFFDLTYKAGKEAQLSRICDRVSERKLPVNHVLDRLDLDILDQGALGIFPNPARNFIRYNTPGISLNRHDVLIYDRFNRLLKSWNRQGGHGEQTLSLDGLPAGIYTLVIQNAEIQLKKQLVKVQD